MTSGDIRDFSGADDPRHCLIDEDGEPWVDGFPGLGDETRGRPPTEEELSDYYVAPGEAHYISAGITYQGEWREPADGLCRAVREHSQALAMYVPVNLRCSHPGSFLGHDLHPDVLPAAYLQEIMFDHTVVAIRQIIPSRSSMDILRGLLLPAAGRIVSLEAEHQILQSTIMYTSWERDRVHDHIMSELAEIGEIWVPCSANYKAFFHSGVPEDRLEVIPHCYDPRTHLATQISWPRGSESVPDGRRFYNIGKWEPRKNQHGLIGAFLQAFTPRDRCSLLVKTFGWGFWDDYPNPEESLDTWIEDELVIKNGWTKQNIKRLVRIVVDRLTDAELNELHRENNIYVSASHGEAWDLPAFDSLCAGNSLVHVGYGGSEDYAPLASRFSHVTEVPHEMGPVHDGYKWEPRAQWAVYDHDDLIAALQDARPPQRRVHPPAFGLNYSRQQVGKRMYERVLRRAEAVGGPRAVDMLRRAGSFG